MKIDYSDLRNTNLVDLLHENKAIEIKVTNSQLKLIKWAWNSYGKYWKAYKRNPSILVHMTYGLRWVLIELVATLFYKYLAAIFHIYVSESDKLAKVGMRSIDNKYSYIKFELKNEK